MSLMTDLRRLRRARLRGDLHRSDHGKNDSKSYSGKEPDPAHDALLSAHDLNAGADHRAQGHKRAQKKPDEILARWTKAVAVFTGVLAVASIIGDVFSFYTLQAINGQLTEMKNGAGDAHTLAVAAQTSAEAAKESANSAQANVEATNEFNRPRIELYNATVVKKNETDPHPHISFALQNAGKSNATVRFIYYKCFVSDVINTTPQVRLSEIRPTTFNFGSQSAPVATSDSMPECVIEGDATAADYEAIKNNKKSFILFLLLGYDGPLNQFWTYSIALNVHVSGLKQVIGGSAYNYEKKSSGNLTDPSQLSGVTLLR